MQHTRSQLIKEGLKLTIQTKRKHSGSDTKDDVEEFEAKRMRREEVSVKSTGIHSHVFYTMNEKFQFMVKCHVPGQLTGNQSTNCQVYRVPILIVSMSNI